MQGTHPATIATFVAYILGTFVLAALSHRMLAKKSFLGEYFLGSRGLGSWALAFTFAATSASGGSFTGFPSLIYTHGWILAFWIASYMIVPICTMGVMGKRLNMVARMTGAITIPDVLRDRYDSTALALFATCTIIFFTVSNLVAQFKAGAIILEETFNISTVLQDVFSLSGHTADARAYLVGLFAFALVVVAYTAYGGFRAVVWTDVMQGIVMGLGVIILLPIILMHPKLGGLSEVTNKIHSQRPTVVTSIQGKKNDLAFILKEGQELDGVKYTFPTSPNDTMTIEVTEQPKLIHVTFAVKNQARSETTGKQIKDKIESTPDLDKLVDIEFAFDNEPGKGAWEPGEGGPRERTWRFIHGDEFLFGPGRTPSGSPFHPLGMAISFFFMWAISGMGQPGTMVRLMAFRESRTLKRAIFTVTFYYALIYLPLIFIFVSARVLLPHIPQESSDSAMVLVATRVVADMGFWYAILAAIFVAAPFAAIMSTVDSFLLMVSSSCVRDVYQRTINPNIGEKAMKWGSYATTAIAGVIVTLLATQKIDFLQYIIVFTGGGFASTFLAPVFLGLYWKGMTRQGALAAMIGGFCIVVGMFVPTMFGGGRINLLGFHPVFWGLFSSFCLGILVSKLTGPAPQNLVDFYFRRPKPETDDAT